MKKFFVGLFLSITFFTLVVSAQTIDGNVTAALKDLSSITGVAITSKDQARDFCNSEKYMVSCAEVGKKYNLFSASEKSKVEVILSELKGKVLEDLKACVSEECLLGVANKITVSLNKKDSDLAKTLDLTAKKIDEKRNILAAAKEIGVDLADCRTLEPETASLELLRACAKLAKNESVKRQIDPSNQRPQAADGSLALNESLRNGEYACGDNTTEGCGNFCLKPVAGATEAPQVCREIASKFFGPQGVKQLESAYAQAQQSLKDRATKVENLTFVTPTGQTLVNPQEIGNYVESQAKSGNVEAVGKGMDFMIAHGFVSKDDKAFAIDFVKKIKDSNGKFNLDACSLNPENCRQYISKEQATALDVRQELSKVFKEEAVRLGVSNSNNCINGGEFSNECLVAAKASLPKMEAFASEHPDASNLVQQMKERIQSAEQSLSARQQAEAKLNSGENITIGKSIFSKFEDVQNYCAQNGQECLGEAARRGFIPKEFAAQKYEQSVDAQKNYIRPQPVPYVPYGDFRPEGAQVNFPVSGDIIDSGSLPAVSNSNSFSKEQALKNFQSWLDNPQGPPPIPGYFAPRPVSPINNFVAQPACPSVFPQACQSGFYRPEIRDNNGCKNYSNECAAIPGYIIPPAPVVVPSPITEIKVVPPAPLPMPVPLPTLAPVVPPTPFTIQCDWNTQYLKASKNICLPRTGCSYPGDSEYNSPECNVIRTSVVWSNSSAPAGQKQIIWNSFGLKSWVSVSANEDRMNKLKLDCMSAPAGANVWMLGAGDSTSVDFGMPDPAKCKVVTPLPMPVPTPLPVVAMPTAPVIATPVTTPTVPVTTTTAPTSTCTPELLNLLGTGCHNMGSAFFDAAMIKWVVPPATVATNCVTSYMSGCSSGVQPSQGQACPTSQYWNGSACVASPAGTACPASQYWNNGVCVATGTFVGSPSSCPANISALLGDGCHAMTEAYFNGPMSQYVRFNSTAVVQCSATSISGCPGTSYTATTPASSCSTSQYWNGAACVVNPATTSTGYSSCPANIVALLGDGCHSMTEAYFNGPMSQYVRFNSTAVVQCSATSISGCPGTSYTAPASSCSASQYWNGTACVASPAGTTACPAGQYLSGGICIISPSSGFVSGASACTSSQYWNGSACVTNNISSTACPAPQYWNGSACVTSSPVPTACTSGQFWNGTACVSSVGAATSACSSGQYWNGTACVASPVAPASACTSGQYWNGTACVSNPVAPTTPPPANLLETFSPIWQFLLSWLK